MERLNADEHRCIQCNKVYDLHDMDFLDIEENITTDCDKYIDFLGERWRTFEIKYMTNNYIAVYKTIIKNRKKYFLSALFRNSEFVEGFLTESSSSEFIINGSGGFDVETFIDFVKRAFKEM